MNDLTNYFWDDLLEYIEESKVIPIVGPELVTVPVDGGETLLYRYIAEQLAERLRIPVADLPESYFLNDMVCRFLGNRGRKEEIYPRIRALLKDVVFPPPQPLLALARINDFKMGTRRTPILNDGLNQSCCRIQAHRRWRSGQPLPSSGSNWPLRSKAARSS